MIGARHDGALPGAAHQFVPAVRAHIVEAAHRTVLAAHDDDRGMGEGETLDLVAAGLGDFFLARDIEPTRIEHSRDLAPIMFFRDARLCRDRPLPEMRIFFRPAMGRDAAHGVCS